MSVETLLGLLQSAFAVAGCVYLVTALSFPGSFKRMFSANDLDRRQARKVRIWLLIAISAIGVGVLTYAATYAVIAAIPYDWGYHDEYEDWYATRDTARMLLTLIGTAFLMISAEKCAEALVWVKLERSARRSLQKSIMSSSCSEKQAIEHAMENLRKDLKIEEYIRDWPAEQQRRFVGDICAQLKHGDTGWV